MFCSNLGLFQALNDINDTETVTATVTTAATTATTATSSSTGTTSISTTSATTSITSSSSTTSSTVKAGDVLFSFFKARWWFHFFFHPENLGKMNPFWRAYFSNGWLKPPTRLCCFDLLVQVQGAFWEKEHGSSPKRWAPNRQFYINGVVINSYYSSRVPGTHFFWAHL